MSVAGTRAPTARRRWALLAAVTAIGATTAVGLVAYRWVDLADLAMLYLVAIGVAATLGRAPALVASSLAVLAFDLCFIPPRFTFAVSEARHLVTFAVMFGTGLTISTLMLRLRAQEAHARRREADTRALLALTADVRDAADRDDAAVAVARRLEEVLGGAAAVLLPEPDGVGLVPAAGLAPLTGAALEAARRALAERRPVDGVTAGVLAAPLIFDGVAVGVAVLQRGAAAPPLGTDERGLLDAVLVHGALAIGRATLAAEARVAELRARAEELRSSLLSVVSHDLRTPLAVITGAATSLRDDVARLTPQVRAELLDTLVDEARRLERVVGNLLDMTRVETGITPAREWVPVEELVGAALARAAPSLGAAEVVLDVPGELALQVDPILFEHVLVNLLENAMKHGRPPLALAARRAADAVELDVADAGPGVAAAAAPHVFDKFFRGAAAPGVGLGLAVVRGIVAAHGGTVALVPDDGGARFRIRLPVTDGATP
ncbi:MAG: DUF4118 domain-containing protein [Kofleriaceae bacterium]